MVLLCHDGSENCVYMRNLGCPYLIYRVCRLNLLVAGLRLGGHTQCLHINHTAHFSDNG